MYPGGRLSELLNFGSIGFHSAAMETTAGEWLRLGAAPERLKYRMQRENDASRRLGRRSS